MARITKNVPPATPFESGGAEFCPLCGGPNACQLSCGAKPGKPCWCAAVTIPDSLLARVPDKSRGRACVCSDCVDSFHAGSTAGELKLLPGDFYFERGLMIFTAAYLRRRGHCCDNNCRHCPYQPRPASA